MPEARELPLFRWGEELRRTRLERRALKLRALAVAIGTLAIVILIGTLLWSPRPLLLWNASSSAPIGLYAVASPNGVRPGEMVVAWTPEPARSLAAERRYLPHNVPLLKRVIASVGDRVCAIGETIFVNGSPVARRREHDAFGRPMPSWTGCPTLADGELFLLMESPNSFDGRYFGITNSSEVVGRAVLLSGR
jgi:conjugative transfer signal peptidase TraF